MPVYIQDKPSKTVQCIRMIRILKSQKYVKKKEIAELLGETTTRNINNYKNALYDAGYVIDFKPGKYGGYFLVHDQLLPASNLKREQLDSLAVMYDYVLEDNNFAYRSLFLDFVGNILGANDTVIKSDSPGLFGHFPLRMSTDEIQKRYYILNTAIDSHKKVWINYSSYRKDIERVIHPYRLYKFNNWHVYAIDDRVSNKKNEYTSFKLHRIKEIKLLDDEFKVDVNYNEEEHFSDRGLHSDYSTDVELRVYGPYGRTLDEKLYGKNQIVTLENEKRLVYNFKATMYDRMVILKFVLSMGANCKVISPKWLQQAVYDNAVKVQQFYKRDDLK